MALMTTREAAAWLGVSEVTLRHDVRGGRLGVPYVRIGRAVRYRVESLDAWVRSREEAPESGAALARRMRGVRLSRRGPRGCGAGAAGMRAGGE